RSRRVVVGGSHDRLDPPRLARRGAQSFIGLRARYFVNEVTIYVKERRTVVLGVDEVAIPELVVKGLWHAGFCSAETRNYDLFSSACGASGLRRLIERHHLCDLVLQVGDAIGARRVC